MAERSYRIGVIGCGDIFNIAHLPAFVNLQDASLVGFYDLDSRQAERTRDRFVKLLQEAADGAKQRTGLEPVGPWNWTSPEEQIEKFNHDMAGVKVYKDAKELLANVDIVDVVTPVKWHVPYAIQALDSGVHAMTEKAMSRTWWEARKVREATERSSKLYQLNDDNVFIPRNHMIKNLMESGAIGDIVTIWINRGSHGPQGRRWFWTPEVSGGGCWMDYGTHAVTTVWFLAGFDKLACKVKANRISTRHPHRTLEGRLQVISGVDDDAHVEIVFEDPKTGAWITAVVEATWTWGELGPRSDDVRGFLKVDGTEGSLAYVEDSEGNGFIDITRYGYGTKRMPVPMITSEEESFDYQIGNFVKCVKENQPSILNEDRGATIMEILGAGYLSELEGRVAVTLDDFRKFSDEISSKHDPSDSEGIQIDIIRALLKPYSK